MISSWPSRARRARTLGLASPPAPSASPARPLLCSAGLATDEGCGLGPALGRLAIGHGGPGLNSSLLVAAVRLGIPLTVHVAIGTDIVHMTPDLDGAALGQATLDDFRCLARLVAGMAGG